jgi:L-asparaginase
MDNTLIITCGGTFSKTYNPLSGEMIVPTNNQILDSLLEKFFKQNKDIVEVQSFIFKDSLDMDEKDRKNLKELIEKTKHSKIIIIHGTDTIDLSAKYIEETAISRNICIVFVGAMEPISICATEGAMNLGCAYGFLQGSKEKGVFISMNGLVKRVTEIKKNHTLGYFECQK